MRRGLRAVERAAGLLLAAALGACSGRAGAGGEGPAASGSAAALASGPPASSASAGAAAQARFAALRDAFVDEWLRDEPAQGRTLGLRASEGKVAGYGREALARRVERLRRARRELEALGPGGLGPEEAFDRALLLYQIDNELFHLVDLDEPSKLPQFYVELFAVDHYIKRDYAPLEDRAERLVEHEEAALAEVKHVRANLAPVLSRPVAETAAEVYGGYADYLRKDVARALERLGPGPLLERFTKANGALAAEAEAIAAHLREAAKRGDQGHVLGGERFLALLRVQEGFEGTLEAFREAGEKDLAQNLRAYEASPAAKLPPARPKPERLLAETTAMVEAARAFVLAKGLVTLATDDTAGVRETPPFMRWNSAFLDASGPLDPVRDAFYYVTPPDPSWPLKERLEYVPTYGDIASTTTHEVYPGHFVQGRWLERAPTRVQKMVSSYSFVEGWAHYAEQMMVEEGFAGGGAEEARRGQLADALLRDCRYVVAHGVHAGGMTLEQAEERFRRDCRQDKATARQQARRATFDPGYFAYTHGKLALLALREEVKQKLGPAFSLRRFHDELLAHGQPPVGLLRARVLAALAPGR
ncbi:MAG TPA: DUF885 domain-containing protein [Polyangiaceae bacterium]|nr:DUF885 domain-containing protein [Polyangiaceae bacterium]